MNENKITLDSLQEGENALKPMSEEEISHIAGGASTAGFSTLGTCKGSNMIWDEKLKKCVPR